MTALRNTPVNYLSPGGFRFAINRLPNVTFYVQRVNLPGLYLGSATMPSPFKPIPVHGDQLQYNDLEITFVVDESLATWTEMHDWLVAVSSPKSFDQYAAARNIATGDGIEADGVLTILNNQHMPNKEVIFENLVPISLSDLVFQSNISDINYLEATIRFKYKIYSIASL